MYDILDQLIRAHAAEVIVVFFTTIFATVASGVVVATFTEALKLMIRLGEKVVAKAWHNSHAASQAAEEGKGATQP